MSGIPGFNETELAKKIVQIDNEWTKKLIEYRAELIHYHDDVVGDSSAFHVFERKAQITISAPKNIFRFFKSLKQHKKELNINIVAFWLIENSLMKVEEVFGGIRNYIEENRVRPKRSEIIKRRDSNPR